MSATTAVEPGTLEEALETLYRRNWVTHFADNREKPHGLAYTYRWRRPSWPWLYIADVIIIRSGHYALGYRAVLPGPHADPLAPDFLVYACEGLPFDVINEVMTIPPPGSPDAPLRGAVATEPERRQAALFRCCNRRVGGGIS